MDRSDLANRMKEYEKRNQYYLQKRTPVAIRVDGRSFHTFTKGFQKPFDKILMSSMQETAKYMCENIQNAKCAYMQSDEITIILVDYDALETDCWFDYRTDKICSIAASMATLKFNMAFKEAILNEEWEWKNSLTPQSVEIQKAHSDYIATLKKAAQKGAMFDARCFNIPKEEVANLIYWRQLDAMRNSIQMVGQANFSHKELQNKSCNDIKEMLLKEKEIDWNSFPEDCKRGSACIKTPPKEKVVEVLTVAGKPLRAVINCSSWFVDKHMPILKEDWNYINKYIYVEE